MVKDDPDDCAPLYALTHTTHLGPRPQKVKRRFVFLEDRAATPVVFPLAFAYWMVFDRAREALMRFWPL